MPQDSQDDVKLMKRSELLHQFYWEGICTVALMSDLNDEFCLIVEWPYLHSMVAQVLYELVFSDSWKSRLMQNSKHRKPNSECFLNHTQYYSNLTYLTRRSAWSDTPVLDASDRIAISFLPSWKYCRSSILIRSRPLAPVRFSNITTSLPVI